ncbi:MAG: hypothetical protein QW721_00350 [Desulfurococcaceae archaeon]
MRRRLVSRWLQLSKARLLKIYLCEYTPFEAIFPRHFITGVSRCSEIATVNYSIVERALGHEQVEKLEHHSEVLLVDPGIVEKLLSVIGLKVNLTAYNYVLIKSVEESAAAGI